jgi:hypothetical protein
MRCRGAKKIETGIGPNGEVAQAGAKAWRGKRTWQTNTGMAMTDKSEVGGLLSTDATS